MEDPDFVIHYFYMKSLLISFLHEITIDIISVVYFTSYYLSNCEIDYVLQFIEMLARIFGPKWQHQFFFLIYLILNYILEMVILYIVLLFSPKKKIVF